MSEERGYKLTVMCSKKIYTLRHLCKWFDSILFYKFDGLLPTRFAAFKGVIGNLNQNYIES